MPRTRHAARGMRVPLRDERGDDPSVAYATRRAARGYRSAMSAVTIHASHGPGEIRVAVVARGVLIDYALWRPGSPDGLGDVYRGRVTGRVPAMAGAFVALAGGVNGGPADGFLPDSEGAKGLTEGTILPVRITRTAAGGKGPRLSARIADLAELSSDTATGLLRRGTDPLRELAIERYPDARVVVDDAALMARLRGDLGDRLIATRQAFDDAIETEVESLASPDIKLASGARMSVHPTPALVAIDVDGGAALGGTESAARRHWMLNAAVMPEVARQIRLRNLSGAIIVDLAGMKAKQRAALGPSLAAALTTDPARPRFLGFTALGLAEIARPRLRAPLHEAIAGPLAAGLTALRAIHRAIHFDPGRRVTLRAAPAVLTALEADHVGLAELARSTGQGLNSRSDPSLPSDGWCIEALHG